jgi:hypothetical protein
VRERNLSSSLHVKSLEGRRTRLWSGTPRPASSSKMSTPRDLRSRLNMRVEGKSRSSAPLVFC